MCQECPEPSSQGASYVLSWSKHNSSIFWSWISLFFLTLSLNKTLFLMFFTLRNGHFLSLSNTRLFSETRFVYARTFRNPVSTLSFKIWNFITRFELVSFKMGITLLVWILFCLKIPTRTPLVQTIKSLCLTLSLTFWLVFLCVEVYLFGQTSKSLYCNLNFLCFDIKLK